MLFRNYCFLLVLICISLSGTVFSQDDLLNELTSEVKAETENDKVTATFKGNKIINAHSCETVKGKTLDFRITHRFSNIVTQKDGSGGPHQLYGFDNASDIRFSFDYGITDRLQAGIARSKQYENIDGSIKYKILEQTENNKVPFTVVWHSIAALSPMKDPDSLFQKFVYRFSYTHQLIIARKFSERFSFELLPSINHRNVVREYVNANNNATEQNTIFALGFAGRYKLTQRFAVVADYFYTFSDFRKNNPDIPYYSPFGVGVEIETGGHVFTMNLTNSSGIIENAFIPYTADSWGTGAFKFGFNISRVFHF
jgi:hypothetical protein